MREPSQAREEYVQRLWMEGSTMEACLIRRREDKGSGIWDGVGGVGRGPGPVDPHMPIRDFGL